MRSLSSVTDVYVEPINLTFASAWMIQHHSEIRDYVMMLLRSEPTMTVIPALTAAADRSNRVAIVEIREAGLRATDLYATTFTSIVLKTRMAGRFDSSSETAISSDGCAAKVAWSARLSEKRWPSSFGSDE